MTIAIGVVMDPIGSITTQKDSTFALLLEAQSRDWPIWYMELSDLFLSPKGSGARMRQLKVEDNSQSWSRFTKERITSLSELDVILMRKDPPFDMEYLYTTHLLEQAEQQGVLVVNRPQTLRDANEKLFGTWFPQCCAPFLVGRDPDRIRTFLEQHKEVVLKPLDGMGGSSIFRLTAGDQNTNVIIETITSNGTRTVMAQRFIPDVRAGDKRILMLDGEPVPYALARIPKADDFRGNLAAGGTGKGIPLSDRDRWIAAEVGPTLKEQGVLFAGLDVIGDYLTEINITSPTCIRELDRQFDLNISASLLDIIENKLCR